MAQRLGLRLVGRKASSLSLAGAATSIIFVAARHFLSRQKYACRDKDLSRQNCHLWQNFCRDKLSFVATNMSFVATKVWLSRQTHTRTTFVATKMIFEAAPASETSQVCFGSPFSSKTQVVVRGHYLVSLLLTVNETL